jgi:hypothetical protein
MKKYFRLIMALCICTIATMAYTQEPPHPNNGNNPGAGNKPVGSTAPLGSGTGMMLLLAASYVSRTLFSKSHLNKS